MNRARRTNLARWRKSRALSLRKSRPNLTVNTGGQSWLPPKEVLVDQRMQCELGMQDAPAAGVPFEEMLSKVTDALEGIDLKHRKQRAKEALTGLINQGYLTREEIVLDSAS